MIAAEVGMSETAFVRSIQQDARDAYIDILFFTPNTQVGLCGHATIAAGAALQERGLLLLGDYLQNTTLGQIPVKSHGTDIFSRKISYRQYVPNNPSQLSREEVADALDIKPSQLLSHKIFQPVGLHTDALVGLRSGEELNSLSPTPERVAGFTSRKGLEGMHVFALGGDGEHYAARSRNFAPRVGIPEESATGSATGLLASELIRQRVITASQARSLVFSQGENLGQPSEIWVHTEGAANEPAIYVGGRAVKDREISVTL